jgi:hypothetical protein
MGRTKQRLSMGLAIGGLGLLVCGLLALMLVMNGLPPLNDLYCKSVTGVAVADGIAYVLTSDKELNSRTYQSIDGGQSWTWSISGGPPALYEPLTSYSDRAPIEACYPDQPAICYRVSADWRLEESQDGRQIWRSAFLPFELKISRPGCCTGIAPATGLVFVKVENAYFLLVGFGTEGLAVRLPSGKWLHRQVDDFRP